MRAEHQNARRYTQASGGDMFRLLILLLLAPAIVAAADLADEVVKGDAGKRLDIHMSALEDAGFSGTVLVAGNGEILLHKGYGMADRGRKIACRPDTIFDIGSITKQFTAAAILKLEAAGELSTDDPLSSFFEDVPSDKADITLHQLLTHTSGLDHGYGDDDSYLPKELALDVFFEMPLLSEPGTSYRYSNPGFSILAAVVENVSGIPYETYLARELFGPAGMTETGYVLPDWDMDRMSRNYNGETDNGFTFNRNWGPRGPWWHCYGNGCILSTTGDMFRWEQALQSNRVLLAESRRKLFAPHVATGDGTSYAYGWGVGKTARGTSWRGHGGGSGFGVAAYHANFPDDGIVVIVMSNQAEIVGGKDSHRFAEQLVELALGT